MNNKQKLILLLAICALAFAARLLPHLPNFTPVAALALFAGVLFRNKLVFILPLGVMLASDLIIGFYHWQVMIAVYASFIVTVLLGMALGKKLSAGLVTAGSLISSTIFFLVTNFAVWLFSGMYEQTLAGLMLCYALALPFFQYTLLGDLFWSGVFFGSYVFAQKKFEKKSEVEQTV